MTQEQDFNHYGDAQQTPDQFTCAMKEHTAYITVSCYDCRKSPLENEANTGNKPVKPDFLI